MAAGVGVVVGEVAVTVMASSDPDIDACERGASQGELWRRGRVGRGVEGGLEGKAGFAVVSVGAGSKVSRADTHRLRLNLNINDAATGGRNLEVRRDEAAGWDE